MSLSTLIEDAVRAGDEWVVMDALDRPGGVRLTLRFFGGSFIARVTDNVGRSWSSSRYMREDAVRDALDGYLDLCAYGIERL